jgi:hypothetical protein
MIDICMSRSSLYATSTDLFSKFMLIFSIPMRKSCINLLTTKKVLLILAAAVPKSR